jgi:uncharacterized membrane protein YphA (DoxX/SURF4 family)
MNIAYLANFTDEALLLLRLMVGAVFFTSGWKHVTEPETRSKDIEMSKGFTLFLGLAECAGALGWYSVFWRNWLPSGSFSLCLDPPTRSCSNGTQAFGANTELTAGATTP